MDSYQSIKRACDSATKYPKTLKQQLYHAYRVESHHKLLQERQEVLFSTENKSRVYVWERESYLHPPDEKNVELVSEDELKRHLGLTGQIGQQDPQIRFMYVCPCKVILMLSDLPDA